MSKIYDIELKRFEQRYGPAIAQHLMDEIEKAARIEKKMKERRLIAGFGKDTIIYHAA